jgi:hypothetical protein
VAKFRDRLGENKQTTQRFCMERFNLKKLNETEVNVEVSNSFAALENLDDDVHNNNAWETKKKKKLNSTV